MLQSDVAGLLKATARTVGSYGPREVGGGLIDAYAAVQELRPATFAIEAPSATDPALAGRISTPQPITVQISKPAAGLVATDFKVTIGITTATILAATEFAHSYELEVLPPVQSTVGTYNLKVELLLTPDAKIPAVSALNAVEYGSTPILQYTYLRSYVDQRSYTAGQPIQLQATIFGTAVITGATVMANLVENPSLQSLTSNGLPTSIQLFDDGLHGDSVANDGIYGATIAGLLTSNCSLGYLEIEIDVDGSDNGRAIHLTTIHLTTIGPKTSLDGVSAGTPVILDAVPLKHLFLPVIVT